MKIVVEITEGQYQSILDGTWCGTPEIAKGTPLPKGHGRLIDANELLKMTKSYKSELGRLKADPFVKCGIETVERFINDLPAIIEGNRSEEE